MHNKSSLHEAIKRRRMEKTKGLDEMNDSQLDKMNEDTRSSGIAPEVKEVGEGSEESQMHQVGHEDSHMGGEHMVADAMDKRHEADVDDLIDAKAGGQHMQGHQMIDDEDKIHDGMYQPGDENMKGFMGKAARSIKMRMAAKRHKG